MLSLISMSILIYVFNVQLVKKSYWAWTETIYIRADGSVDPLDVPIFSADNITYSLTDNIAGDFTQSGSKVIILERDNIVFNGAGYTIQGAGWERFVPRGIYLTGRSNVTIKNTTIKSFYIGICLHNSSNNNISGNNMINNDIGIALYNSSKNNISRNNITKNNSGIFIRYSSSNSISGNNITKNHNSIWLWASSNDKFYHNNFIGNTNQVLNYLGDPSAGYYEPPSISTWDDGYPSGGNYWSDYTGLDAKQDGIGDTPYIIDEYNKDNYPLMGAQSPVEPSPLLFWALIGVGIIVSVGAIYFFKKRKATNSAPHTTE
jgi:parallel beta-helix repeat protein